MVTDLPLTDDQLRQIAAHIAIRDARDQDLVGVIEMLVEAAEEVGIDGVNLEAVPSDAYTAMCERVLELIRTSDIEVTWHVLESDVEMPPTPTTDAEFEALPRLDLAERLDLDAIRARVADASKGPWTCGADGLVWAPRLGDPVSSSELIEDAKFIAHARTDVPALLAEVERLTGELATMTGHRDDTQIEYDDMRDQRDGCRAALRAVAERLDQAGAERDRYGAAVGRVWTLITGWRQMDPAASFDIGDVVAEVEDALSATQTPPATEGTSAPGTGASVGAGPAGGAPPAEVAKCGRCLQPFDPTDDRWNGYARHQDTPWCRSCIDRCHESTDFAHECPVCADATGRGEVTG